jgi:hypothetical protein
VFIQLRGAFGSPYRNDPALCFRCQYVCRVRPRPLHPLSSRSRVQPGASHVRGDALLLPADVDDHRSEFERSYPMLVLFHAPAVYERSRFRPPLCVRALMAATMAGRLMRLKYSWVHVCCPFDIMLHTFLFGRTYHAPLSSTHARKPCMLRVGLSLA